MLWSYVVVQSLSQTDSLRPHGLQHARFSCPSPSPGVYSNSCPLSRWCHPTISPSAHPSSPFAFSLPQHQSLFQWVSSLHKMTKVLVLLMNIQDWFPLGLTDLISLQFNGLSRVFVSTTIWKHRFFSTQPSLWSNNNQSLDLVAYWLLAFIYLPQDLDHCCMPTLHMLFILRRKPQSGQRDPIWRALDWFWPKPKGLSRTRTS